MGGLVAIDPGNKAGFAIFDIPRVRLEICGLFGPDVPEAFEHASLAVIELPQVYRQSKMKGDPNDLIKLAVEVGRLTERLSRRCVNVQHVKPAEWKGQVPKEIHHKRIAADLMPVEIACVDRTLANIAKSYQHNVWDAIGLGLWWLKKNGLR